MNSSFFSMKSARQPVNSTLVGIFLASWCLWTVVYYVNQSVEIATAAFTNEQTQLKTEL